MALVALMLLSGNVYAQFDVFGGMAPKDKQKTATSEKKNVKKFSLPDKPNVTDAQGRKQGEWCKKYENGQYVYVATFKDGKPVGTTVRYYETGKKSSELTYNADGTIYAVMYFEDEKVASKGLFTADHQRTGKWEFYNEDGYKVALSTYKNGKLNGTSFTYFDNGAVSDESNYVDDVLHGPWFQYLPNGKRRLDTHYVNGKLDGLYKYWNVDGELSVEGYYRNGVQIGDWKIYESEATKKFFLMKYDNNGHLLNEEEVQQRMNDFMDKCEETRKFIVDPQDYINNPESYRP